MKELNFKSLGLRQEVQDAIDEMGYMLPTEIQAKAIPEIIKGHDVIGQSQTGTGKTASFVIPMLEKIDLESKETQVLILCPTRELAVQVSEETKKIGKYVEGLTIVPVYGGQGIDKQIPPLRRGAQIIVGTPGRIMDHMRRKTVKLNAIKTVILDEADEMLDMGFEEDIETILTAMPEARQTVLFSATMPKKTLNLTKKYQKNPTFVKITPEELTITKIKQVYFDVKEKMKLESLIRLLDIHNPNLSVVFCNTKRKVDEIIEQLQEKGYKVEGLHGDMKQQQRDNTMRRFKKGDTKILVATDVAARGIDVNDLSVVFNYDVPQSEEYYVHRIGRTGRAGKEGKAFTFVVGREKNKLRDIERYAKTKLKEEKLPTLAQVEEIREQEKVNKFKEIIENKKFVKTNMFDKLLSEGYTEKQIALAAMSIALEGKDAADKNAKDELHEKFDRNDSSLVKLFLNVGKSKRIAVKDIVGSITAYTSLSGSDIGKIAILDKYSFVEVPASYVPEIMKCMKDKQIKGINVKFEVSNS